MREKREVSIPGVTRRSTAYHSLICAARRRRWRPRPPPTGYYFACPFVLSASERSKPVPRRGIVEGIANTTEYPSVRSQGDASVRASALCSAVPPFLRVIVCRSVLVSFLRVPFHLIGELVAIFPSLYLQQSFWIVVVLDYVWLLRCGTTSMASSLCSHKIGTSHSLSLSHSWSLANAPAYRVPVPLSCSFSLASPLQIRLRVFSFPFSSPRSVLSSFFLRA